MTIFFAIIAAFFVIVFIRAYCRGLAIKNAAEFEMHVNAEVKAREHVKAANARVEAWQQMPAQAVTKEMPEYSSPIEPLIELLSQPEQATADDYYNAWRGSCGDIAPDKALEIFRLAYNSILASEADRVAIEAAGMRWLVDDCGMEPID